MAVKKKVCHDLSGIEYKTCTMSVTWGRVVPIPPQPIYVPKRLRKMLMPPPPTKQPFNALHPDMRQLHSVKNDPDAKELWEKVNYLTPPPQQVTSTVKTKTPLYLVTLEQKLSKAATSIVLQKQISVNYMMGVFKTFFLRQFLNVIP